MLQHHANAIPTKTADLLPPPIFRRKEISEPFNNFDWCHRYDLRNAKGDIRISNENGFFLESAMLVIFLRGHTAAIGVIRGNYSGIELWGFILL